MNNRNVFAENMRKMVDELPQSAEVTRALALDTADNSEKLGQALATAGLIGGLIAIVGRLEHEVVKLTGSSIVDPVQ